MPLAVVAVGGNALIKDKNHKTVADQYMAAVETMKHITKMIEKGWNVIITHGNGPQVGFILLRSDLAEKEAGLHNVPLDSCGADTQGAIGYIFQQVLMNEFKRKNIPKEAVTVVTRVLVDKKDPAFSKPAKPIGSFMSKEEAEERKASDGWDIVQDAGRGYRRVVPSPEPIEILEEKAIELLAANDFIVIAVGGGGIPVYKREDGVIVGIEAVIDKDFASSLLASNINADLLLICTVVEKVFLNFGKPDEKALDTISVEEAEKYLKEGHFAPGSMAPKIKAVIKYLKNGGRKAIITSSDAIEAALEGKTGTCIIP
jgi:carbamate kinase